jgi:hypothetical protein
LGDQDIEGKIKVFDYYAWAAIGVIAYYLWKVWVQFKKHQVLMDVANEFRSEWLFLKSLIAGNYESFKLQLQDDGLPIDHKYLYVRMYYELNKSKIFMTDIKDNFNLLPPDVSYQQLVDEDKKILEARLWVK